MLALPSQTPGLLERYELTRADADREAFTIDRAGRKLAGAAALNRVFEELGGGWSWLGAAYRVGPVRWVEDRIYRWIAAHRSWFARWGTTPECEQPGVDCEP